MERTFGDLVYEFEGDDVVVHADKCGRRFARIAYVRDLASGNPLVSIDRPLGLNAVEQIVRDVRTLAAAEKELAKK